MSRALSRCVLVAAVAAGVAGSAGAADAACYGTQNTVGVCEAKVTVYEDCVYLGPPPCTPVAVVGPACVYGWIGPNTTYQTSFC